MSNWKSIWERCIVLCNICIKEVVAKILITCRHFILQQVYGEFNIFICFSVKPSVAVTEQSVENKNKRMFVEVLHETLTRETGDTLQYLITNGRENGKTWRSYSIFTIIISFSNFSLCWSVKKISLSVQMVRETGSLTETPLPIVVFFISAFFSCSFKLECGKGRKCICYSLCDFS